MTTSGTVVVGGAKGIGQAVSRRLVRETWAGPLVIADVDLSAAEALAGELGSAGGDCRALRVDVSDPASITALAEAVPDAGRLAIVAGIHVSAPSLEAAWPDFERVLTVNVLGNFFVAQAFARGMVERGSGAIVALSSVSGRLARVNQAAYCASKAAIRQALRCLALEPCPTASASTRSRRAPRTPRCSVAWLARWASPRSAFPMAAWSSSARACRMGACPTPTRSPAPWPICSRPNCAHRAAGSGRRRRRVHGCRSRPSGTNEGRGTWSPSTSRSMATRWRATPPRGCRTWPSRRPGSMALPGHPCRGGRPAGGHVGRPAARLRRAELHHPPQGGRYPAAGWAGALGGISGACNTVVRQPDGRLIGSNTDGSGFLWSLRDEGIDPAGLDVVLLGAGGAARAVAVELALAGARRITVANRGPARREALMALLERRTSVEVASLDWHGRLAVPPCDVLVDCTPVGMGSGAAAEERVDVDLAALSPAAVVCDLNPEHADTAFLRWARERGHRTIGGLGMLARQGAAAFSAGRVSRRRSTSWRPRWAIERRRGRRRAAAEALSRRRPQVPGPSVGHPGPALGWRIPAGHGRLERVVDPAELAVGGAPRVRGEVQHQGDRLFRRVAARLATQSAQAT